MNDLKMHILQPIANLTVPLRIAVGVCVPDTCNSTDVIEYITGGGIPLQPTALKY